MREDRTDQQYCEKYQPASDGFTQRRIMNVVFTQSRGTAAKQSGKRECEDPSQQTPNFARKAAHDADKYRDQPAGGDGGVNSGPEGIGGAWGRERESQKG